MAIILDGTTGITAPDITSAAGLDAADLTGSLPLALKGIIKSYSALNTVRSTVVGVSSGFVQVPGTTITLTPASTSSKFLIFARVYGEGGSGDGHNWSMAIFRNGTNVNGGTSGTIDCQSVIATAGSDYFNNDADSTPQDWSTTTLDAPNTTSQLEYSLQLTNQGGTGTFYLNGTVSATNTISTERGSSELIILELNV